MILEKGIIQAYDPTTHEAAVQLFGSMSRTLLGIPVADHIPGHLLTQGAACAVAFFAEGSQGVVFATFGGALPPVDRGYTDDFMGDALHPQYAAVSAGAGSSGFLNPHHGGAYILQAGAAVWATQTLWLGDAAGVFATLDADLGWMMAAKMSVSAITDTITMFGAADATLQNFLSLIHI